MENVVCNQIISAQNYLEAITGQCYVLQRTNDCAFIREVLSQQGLDAELWDYPLDEIDHIVENDLRVVLVDCNQAYGDKVKHNYRWFEVPEDVSFEEEKIDTPTKPTLKHTLWSNSNKNNKNLSLDDLKAEVKDIVFDTPIAVLASTETCNGVAVTLGTIKSGKLSDCFFDSCNHFEWYVDENKDLHFTGRHFAGSNSYLYRVYKDELDDEDIEEFEDKVLSNTVTKEDIEKYTYGIGDVFAKLFGWED